jgi:hypothetical protein
MGGPLGDDYRCWQPALHTGLWCADCQRDIDHGTKGTCRCPGCSRDYMAEVAQFDGRGSTVRRLGGQRMSAIWKYPLPFPGKDMFALDMPEDARLLRVEVQRGVPCLWALVEPGKPLEMQQFAIVGTGHPCPDIGYVGSFHLLDGDFVGHLFVNHGPLQIDGQEAGQ